MDPKKSEKQQKPVLNRKMISANWSNLQSSIPKTKSPKKPKQFKTNIQSPMSNIDERIMTNALAIDCEMVGIHNDQSMLARVSIVNERGEIIIDKYVKPTQPVLNYRTAVSGIRPKDIECGEDFSRVQKEVAAILRNRILVGHAIRNDLLVLSLNHPRHLLRDTAHFKPLRRHLTSAQTPSLKNLANSVLGIVIQSAEHCSVEDARAVMKIYQLFKESWERDVKAANRRRQ